MSPLHHIGEFVRGLLMKVPLWSARALFVLLLVTLLIWVLRLPREAVIERPNESVRLTENLKLWAAIALGIQVMIYALL